LFGLVLSLDVTLNKPVKAVWRANYWGFGNFAATAAVGAVSDGQERRFSKGDAVPVHDSPDIFLNLGALNVTLLILQGTRILLTFQAGQNRNDITNQRH
jgi:hypothetical protein